VNGKALPRFKPDRVVTAFLEREVDRSRPGDKMSLSVLRDGKQIEIQTSLAEAPKLAREAQRRFFERVGFTARDFVFSDAVIRRAKLSECEGVIAHFVKPSGPANTAGLQTDDWIKQIDGADIKTFEQAAEKLAAIEADTTRDEFVLLVSRNGETSVLRVKMR
jgi:serine protease Do